MEASLAGEGEVEILTLGWDSSQPSPQVGIAKKGNSESMCGRPEISVCELALSSFKGKELGYRTDGGVAYIPSNMLLPHEKSMCEMRWGHILTPLDPVRCGSFHLIHHERTG